MPTQTDIIVGTVFCVVVAEASRRTMGMFLLGLAAIFIGYLFVGPWLPDILAHGGFGFRRVIRPMYMSNEGVFGIAVSALRPETRMNLGKILAAPEAGARNTVSTAIACASVGFIVGSVGLSGIGLLFTQSIIGLAQGELLPALLLAAGSSLFLSFGLPTTSVYIITATLVAPSLAQMGVPPLVAHLFCHCWGGVSAITPPVALAAYVGAGIAGAPVMKTGFTAMRLGMAAYLVPFIYVYWPTLVMWHEAPLYRVVLALFGGAVGVFCMGAIGERYITRELPWTQMALLAIAIVAVMHPVAIANVIAVAIELGVAAWEWRARPAPLTAT